MKNSIFDTIDSIRNDAARRISTGPYWSTAYRGFSLARIMTSSMPIIHRYHDHE